MIKLDYRTNNPRHGKSGINFDNWEEYVLVLGFLSNPEHYKGTIKIVIEQNNNDGAWEKEGRIQYFGGEENLKNYLFPLYKCKSAGVGKITCRINSNEYVSHLIKNYNFKLLFPEKYTSFLEPPTNSYNYIWNMFLKEKPELESLKSKYDEGWYIKI